MSASSEREAKRRHEQRERQRIIDNDARRKLEAEKYEAAGKAIEDMADSFAAAGVAAEETAGRIMFLGSPVSVAPPSALSVYWDDEEVSGNTDTVKVNAENALQFILDDITAETLISDEAVLARAGEWLTRITNEITAVIQRKESKDG